MTWEKYSKEHLIKMKTNSSTLICDESLKTGYVRCRGTCCNKCTSYNSCDYNYKCTAEDINECFS